jgi:hypothetical protein
VSLSVSQARPRLRRRTWFSPGGCRHCHRASAQWKNSPMSAARRRASSWKAGRSTLKAICGSWRSAADGFHIILGRADQIIRLGGCAGEIGCCRVIVWYRHKTENDAVGFAGLPRPSYDRALWALRRMACCSSESGLHTGRRFASEWRGVRQQLRELTVRCADLLLPPRSTTCRVRSELATTSVRAARHSKVCNSRRGSERTCRSSTGRPPS